MSIRFCEFCSTVHPDEATHCPDCGTRLVQTASEEDFNNFESVGELESRFTPGQEDVAQYNLNDGEVIKFNYGIFQYVKR